MIDSLNQIQRQLRGIAGRTFIVAALTFAAFSSASAEPSSLSSAPLTVPEVEFERMPDGPDRALHTMVHDSFNDLLWSFAGVQANFGSNRFFNTLYKLDLSDPSATWELVPISGLKPPPLAFHSAVFDPVRQQMIVFGGIIDRDGTSRSSASDTNSVWLLDTRDPLNPLWSRETARGNAVDRFAHAAVYVPEFDVMVVSAGAQTFSRFRSDNYALLLGETPMRWVRLANAGFTPRAAHALMYDDVGKRLLAYGGLDEDNDANRTLIELDLSGEIDGADVWDRVSTDTPGLDRGFAATAYDPVRRLWWFHGGQDRTNFLNDLSALDLSVDPPEWVRTGVVRDGPNRRFAHVAVWDPIRDRAIFQGGTPDDNRTLRDTKALNMLGDDPPTVTPSATAIIEEPTPSPSPTLTLSPSATTEVTTTPSATPPDETTPTATSTTVVATPTLTAVDFEIDIEGFAFDPNPITVPVGSTVRWTNRDAAPHTTTSGEPGATTGVWDSGTLATGESFEFTFTTVGEFKYFCAIHPAMRGTVFVIDPSAPTPSPTTLPTTPPTPEDATIYLPLVMRSFTLGGSPPVLPTATMPVPIATPTLGLASLELIGQFGGESNAVTTNGTLVAVNVGPRVLIVDVSDPDAPSEIARTDIFPDLIRGLTFEGDMLYVAHDSGFDIFDVADPATPIRLSTLAANGAPRNIEIIGTTAYIAGSPDISIVDISDPTAPEAIESFRVSGFAYDVEVEGDRAYLATSNGLAIVDVSVASAPTLLGEFATSRAPVGVAVNGNVAVLGNTRDGLFVIDVTDPTAPAELAIFDTGGRPHSVEFDGDRLFAANDFAGLAIIDLSDPAAPVLETAFDTTDRTVRAIALQDELVLLANNTDGLRVVDVSDTTAPALGGAIQTPARGIAVELAGDIAITSIVFEGLLPIDVSDPSSPVPLTLLDEFSGPNVMEVVGNRLYSGDGSRGFTIQDISDPAAPVEISRIADMFGTTGLQVVGTTVYVVDRSSGLHVIDISDEAAPTEIGLLAIEGNPSGLAVTDGAAYVTRGLGQAIVVDITDATAPALGTTLETSEFARSAVVDGNRLFVADPTSGLMVFDISAAASPSLQGSVEIVGGAAAIEVRGDIAYVTDYSGMAVVDVSDPAAPQLLVREFLYGRQFGIAVTEDGSRAILAGDGGLLVIGVTIR